MRFLAATGTKIVLLRCLLGATGVPILLLRCILRATGEPIVLMRYFGGLVRCQLHY